MVKLYSYILKMGSMVKLHIEIGKYGKVINVNYGNVIYENGKFGKVI